MTRKNALIELRSINLLFIVNYKICYTFLLFLFMSIGSYAQTLANPKRAYNAVEFKTQLGPAAEGGMDIGNMTDVMQLIWSGDYKILRRPYAIDTIRSSGPGFSSTVSKSDTAYRYTILKKGMDYGLEYETLLSSKPVRVNVDSILNDFKAKPSLIYSSLLRDSSVISISSRITGSESVENIKVNSKLNNNEVDSCRFYYDAKPVDVSFTNTSKRFGGQALVKAEIFTYSGSFKITMQISNIAVPDLESIQTLIKKNETYLKTKQ